MPGNYNPNNIFAKIIAGDLPSHMVYEDDVCISIMDIMPESNGHVLVISRQGARNLMDIDPDILAEMMKRVQKIAIATKHAMNADGILLRQHNEEVAGQTVYHLHFHIIPCYLGQARNAHTSGTTSEEELAGNAQKIRASL